MDNRQTAALYVFHHTVVVQLHTRCLSTLSHTSTDTTVYPPVRAAYYSEKSQNTPLIQYIKTNMVALNINDRERAK